MQTSFTRNSSPHAMPLQYADPPQGAPLVFHVLQLASEGPGVGPAATAGVATPKDMAARATAPNWAINRFFISPLPKRLNAPGKAGAREGILHSEARAEQKRPPE